ncbi:MAG: glycosyltransferase [Proteobacteria bacterium]|nr:glycosyltransferase [Pseudomonadota bacterium]
MPNITAIIVNYNAGDMLLESVMSLLREACVCKIIVIDNNSKDKSMDAIERLAEGESRLLYIRNSENLGFARACNMAIPMVQ